MARYTSKILKSTGAWEVLEKELHGKLKDVDTLHKYDQQDFGGELVYARACRSVRVAYSTVVERANGDVEVAHIYCAMGLEKQHHFQQVILGRFKDLTIGAHFLSAVCSELAVSFRAELLSVCLLYTSPSPRDGLLSRMPSSA